MIVSKINKIIIKKNINKIKKITLIIIVRTVSDTFRTIKKEWT